MACAEAKACWLRLERFDYSPLAGRWAVARLLANLGEELQVPATANLVVQRGPTRTSHGAFVSAIDRRLTTSGSELLWVASFAIPLEVVECQSAIFELSSPGRPAVALPAAGSLALTQGLAAAEEMRRWSSAELRRRFAALATAFAVTTASTGSTGIALAEGVHGAGGPAAGGAKAPAALALTLVAPSPKLTPAATLRPVSRPIKVIPVPLPTAPAGRSHRASHTMPLKPPVQHPSGGAAIAITPVQQKPAPPPTLRLVAAPPKPDTVSIARPAPGTRDETGETAPLSTLSSTFPSGPGANAAAVAAGGLAASQLSAMFVDGLQPPPFLIPIYQQAGRRYHVPWQVLAAINSIETNYGRDLNVSSAGAIGWMQFMPATWRAYGVDTDGTDQPNPYDPSDAIFSAARYLAANGVAHDLRGAIFAYNHAGWYVDEVLMRASAIKGFAGTASLASYDLLLVAANAVSAANFPYHWGGGHEQPARFEPFDCSGAVSYIVQQAGYAVPTATSGEIGTWGFPAGPGLVTIFYNAGHTFMRIGNRYWGTSGFARPNGGAGWFDQAPSAQYLAGFATVHLPALKTGRVINLPQSKPGSAPPFNAHGLALPLDAPYMKTLGRTDDGVDIETAPDGSPVYSMTPGVVTAVASDPTGFGPNYPVIRATQGPLAGRFIYYGHVATSLVTVNQHVTAGQPIAIVGHTGDAASLGHGHIEIGLSDASGNPLNHGGATAWTQAGAAMRQFLVELSAAFRIKNS